MKKKKYNINNHIKHIFPIHDLNKCIHSLLYKKYNCSSRRYNKSIINNIVFNFNSRKVSHFKDYLLLYDPNDFIRRFYFKKESISHLKYYFSFYEENNKIFPNYYGLPESKYIYWNIRQKQNILNNIEFMNMKLDNKKHKSYGTIFSSSVKKSIYNESEYPSNSMNSKEDDDLNKLIKAINENYSDISYLKKKEINVNINDVSAQNANKIMNSQKVKLNNNLFTKISLISQRKENENIFDVKNKLKYENMENICLSDRTQNLNQKNKNSKSKHKRFMTIYNKELIPTIYGNSKKTIDIKKTNKKTAEKNDKINKLIKAMKLVFKNNDSTNKNLNNNTTDIDSNNNIKISNTSRNMNINSKLLKSLLNKVNTNKINFKKNLNKNTKIKNKNFENSSNKAFSTKRNEKTNKKFLNHIKANSNLTDSIYKNTNIYQQILTNNNSVSFNSPFLHKIENKLLPTESYPKIKTSTQKIKYKKKLLIRNVLTNKRKAMNDLYIKERGKNAIDKNKNKEENKELNDFLTQINFKNKKLNNKIFIKDAISKTAEKIKINKKESKISSLMKNNRCKCKQLEIKNNGSKKKKILKSKNNTTLNSININVNSINNLKISNNLFTTINIFGIVKNKKNNKSKRKKGLNTERSNYKISNETHCFENKKLLKIINDYKHLSKKNQINFKNDYITRTKRNHNKTNSSIYNNYDTINKTSNNFNHSQNKNIVFKSSYNYMTNKKIKLKIRNVKPSLVKKFDKFDKDFIYPQNSDRMTTCYKNNDSSKINLKGNNTVRKISNDEKANMITCNLISTENKNQKKIKIKNFKKLIDNLNSGKKEIDRNKLHDILSEKNKA